MELIAKYSSGFVSLILAGMLTFGVGTMVGETLRDLTPQCQTEDQTSGVCSWDSSHGRDFLNVYGVTVYEDFSVEKF